MTNYVLGFAFFPNGDVVLIEKTKPEWQRGKVNGVGGKIEEGESLTEAMRREFQEETGVVTEASDWKCFTTMKFWDVRVFCLTTRLPKDAVPRTTTEEKVRVVGPHSLYAENTIYNLDWLIPMAAHFIQDPDSDEVPSTLEHE